MRMHPLTGERSSLDPDMTFRELGVVVRPIEPDDETRLATFHSNLSIETTHSRYFSPHPTLTERELEFFTHVDHRDREALVALHDDEIVAVARYERLGAQAVAEVAFVVADAWQHRGLGSAMFTSLADLARARGVERVVAETQSDNRAMIAVFERCGLPSRHVLDHGVFHYEMQLDHADTDDSRSS
ncbi:MAG: GNAT family N-acetyltransferase [Acidimicrobiales bacterium]